MSKGGVSGTHVMDSLLIATDNVELYGSFGTELVSTRLCIGVLFRSKSEYGEKANVDGVAEKCMEYARFEVLRFEC